VASFEAEIKAFEAADKINKPKMDGILFLGSSSIRLWKSLADDFPGKPVINRGFGGSMIADSTRYATRIVYPYRPSVIVFYAGDNDIAAGHTPEQVLSDYKAFVEDIREAMPDTRILFISIKPSLARWKLAAQMQKANELVRDYSMKSKKLEYVDVWEFMIGADGTPRKELFGPDGLHMNERGYQLWKLALQSRL
jgi:lysophospholipase L1-like esterase